MYVDGKEYTKELVNQNLHYSYGVYIDVGPMGGKTHPHKEMETEIRVCLSKKLDK